MASSETRLSRDEWKKKNELDELRKSGALEPEKDAEGNEINPHIPQYMSEAPWYLNTGAGLKHTKDYRNKSVAEGVAARSVAAIGKSKKISGSRDEFGEKIKATSKTEQPRANGYDASYAGKRDRWNGYDPTSYLRVMNKHELLSVERQRIREANVDESLQVGGKKKDKKKEKEKREEDDSSSSDDDDEPEIDAEKAEMLDMDENVAVGQKIAEGSVGMRTRVSVRNLRIREDTAKYLRNLDTGSAYYDPKTRSMRSNPTPDVHPEDADFAGDNFIRYTGQAKELASQQLYEFEAYERGQQVHMLAMPTQAEKLHITFAEKKDSLVGKQKEDLMEKYGGREHSENQLPASLKYGQSEKYVEYSEDGRVLKGEENVAKVSKYEENKMVNNHTKVWGSFWHNGQWGYACCCQHVRNSYCTGATGTVAFTKQKGNRIGFSPLYENSSQMMVAMQQKVVKKDLEKAEEKKMAKMGDRNEGKSLADFDKKALKKALKAEEKRQNEGDGEGDDKKRKYNSLGTSEVTEEEMEAYMLKKKRDDDPAMMGKGTKGYDMV